MLNPEFPIIEGPHQLTRQWAVTLPNQFNRRVEDGQLCIWRPGLTIWCCIWNNDNTESIDERLAWIQGTISSDAFNIKSESRPSLATLSYRLHEENAPYPTLYAFAVAEDSHIQLAIYFDDEADYGVAQAICHSVSWQE